MGTVYRLDTPKALVHTSITYKQSVTKSHRPYDKDSDATGLGGSDTLLANAKTAM
jgi:hypothetical protein